MLLAAGVLFEWGRLIQLLLWIILPVFLLAFLVTWLHHFRRKKKNAKPQETEYSFASPEQNGNGAYLLFDHTGLLRQYRNKLSYSHARYRALQQDYEKLETKYAAAANTRHDSFLTLQNSTMEKTNQEWEEMIHAITATFETEKQQLHHRLEQLDKSYRKLESENELLVEQVSMVAATGAEKEIFVNRWREENQVLREKLNGQAWLHDLVEEKKRQVEFLQSQLENRIKGFHEAEQGRVELVNRLQEKENQLDEQAEKFNEMQSNLRVQQEESHAKAMQLTNTEQELNDRSNHIIFLENTLKEIKAQNEMLQAEIADRRQEYSLLQQQRDDERSQLLNMEKRLAANKQMLQRLYKEISSCVEETPGPSQVVMMHPAYINEGPWEETATP